MDYIDLKYIDLISTHVRNFKRKSRTLWNFSCPYCGDSKKNKLLARGYLMEKGGRIGFYCHNCNVPGVSLYKLLKHLSAGLATQYKFDKIACDTSPTPKNDYATTYHKPLFGVSQNNPLIKAGCERIDSLPPHNLCRRYVEARQIPDIHYKHLYFIEKASSLQPLVKEHKLDDHPKLVIPFFDTNKDIFAFQLRRLNQHGLRYQTEKLIEHPLVYGLERFDRAKKSYVVEGPIDSLFLPNSLAAGGSAIPRLSQFVDIENTTIVFDNERRNNQLVAIMDTIIGAGHKVCLFPESVALKDINDMIVKGGLTGRQVVDLIEENSYQGMKAKLVARSWRRTNLKRDFI